MSHIAPWQCNFAKEDRSECRSGKLPKSNKEYFEILCLCILQAGLSWKMIREKWQKLRKSFYNFNFERLANSKPHEILRNVHAIKNIRKINAIIEDAKEFKRILKEYNSFARFLTSLRKLRDEEVIKILTRRFKHLGEYSARYYLHSIGWKAMNKK